MSTNVIEFSRAIPLRKQACTCCRQKKKRCDAGKPTCRRCAKRKTQCTYQLVPPEVTMRVRLAKQNRKEVKAMTSGLCSAFSDSSSSSSSSSGDSSSADEGSSVNGEIDEFLPPIMLHSAPRSCLRPRSDRQSNPFTSNALTAWNPFTSLEIGCSDDTSACEPPENDFFKMLAIFSFDDTLVPDSAFSPPWPECAAHHKPARFPINDHPTPSVLAKAEVSDDTSASSQLLLTTPLYDTDTDTDSGSVSSPETDESDHSGLGIWSPEDLYGSVAAAAPILPFDPNSSLIDAFLHLYGSSGCNSAGTSTPDEGRQSTNVKADAWTQSAGLTVNRTSVNRSL